MMASYRCTTCGDCHDGPPLSYVSPAPALFYGIPERARETRCKLSSDQCVIDDEFFFILGNVSLPIVDDNAVFVWTVWVSLSEVNFNRVTELWEAEGREKEPPYFGWLCTALPTYPDTLNLKTHVHTQRVGIRPEVEIEATEHPLAVEQRDGVDMNRVREIAAFVLHGNGS